MGTALLAVLPLCATTLTAQAAQRYTLSGSDVAIYNLAGTMRVEAGTGTDIVVEVTRGGSDAGKLQIATGPIGTRQTLRVIYPGDDITYPALGRHSSSTVDVRDDGTFDEDHHGWGRGHRVRISGDEGDIEAFADLRILVPPGKKLAVHLAVGQMGATNVNGDLKLDVSSADVTATGTRGSLVIDAGSGDVRVSNVMGAIDLDTGSGNVDVTGASGDELLIDTGSGDVTVDRAEVRTLKIDTGSGNAEASGVKADDLKLDTGSGDVRLTLLSGGGSIDIDTGSGQVDLTLPSTYGADVLLDTGSGGIDLGGIELTVRKLQEDHVEGRIGDGHARLHVETGSGEIRLKKA
jgi:hypothetical protein